MVKLYDQDGQLEVIHVVRILEIVLFLIIVIFLLFLVNFVLLQSEISLFPKLTVANLNCQLVLKQVELLVSDVQSLQVFYCSYEVWEFLCSVDGALGD